MYKRQVFEACNGKQALEYLTSDKNTGIGHIDILLTDVKMPFMDGIEPVSYTHLDVYKRQTYLKTVMGRIEDRFSKEELETMERMLNVISAELMPEIKY